MSTCFLVIALINGKVPSYGPVRMFLPVENSTLGDSNGTTCDPVSRRPQLYYECSTEAVLVEDESQPVDDCEGQIAEPLPTICGSGTRTTFAPIRAIIYSPNELYQLYGRFLIGLEDSPTDKEPRTLADVFLNIQREHRTAEAAEAHSVHKPWIDVTIRDILQAVRYSSVSLCLARTEPDD